MEKREEGSSRCHACRYWFERCCHALALMEGDNKHSAKCMHFVNEMTPPPAILHPESWNVAS